MKEFLSYRIPPREETIITLYDTGFIEIYQEPPQGEDTFPVRINTEDIATIQGFLDKMRRYKEGPESETPAQQPPHEDEAE